MGYKGETNRQIFTHKHTQHPRSDGSVVVMASLTERNPLRVRFNKQIHLQNNQAEDAAKTFGYTVKYRIFEETFLLDILFLTLYFFFSLTSYIQNTDKSSVVPKSTENTETTNSKNMHSGDHFGLAAVSTTDTFLLLKQLCVTCFSAQQRRCRHSQLQES